MGRRDRACAAVLNQSGERILMVYHNDRANGGYWTLPGGAREAGETLEEAAVREVLEETGLLAQSRGAVFDETYAFQGRFELGRCFLCEATAGYEVNLGHDPEDAHLDPAERLLHRVEWKSLTEVADHKQVRQVVRFLREGTQGLLRGAETDPAQPLRDLTHFRVHTADLAWATKRPRGLFVTIGKLAESGTLTEAEAAEYWQNRHWFEAHLPVPPLYHTGNPDGTITWYKNTPAAMQLWEKMTFYRAMAQKYGVELFRTSTVAVPGRVVYEDEFQIAVVDAQHEGEAFLTERLG